MSLTAATVQAAFVAARTALSGATVTVGKVGTGHTYTGVMSATERDAAPGGGNGRIVSTRAVRLNTAELKETWGETEQITVSENGADVTYTIQQIIPDQLNPHGDANTHGARNRGATMLVRFGDTIG